MARFKLGAWRRRRNPRFFYAQSTPCRDYHGDAHVFHPGGETMARPLAELFLQQIRLVAGRDAAGGASDAELLRHFLNEGDEAAFAALVRRHGAMVWQVCRSALVQREDAEDVFQATFLVLARKAGTVRKPESLACW